MTWLELHQETKGPHERLNWKRMVLRPLDGLLTLLLMLLLAPVSLLFALAVAIREIIDNGQED